eukprot:1161580-Pelagomonas_calceolata.AAC.13
MLCCPMISLDFCARKTLPGNVCALLWGSTVTCTASCRLCTRFVALRLPSALPSFLFCFVMAFLRASWSWGCAIFKKGASMAN